MAETSTDSFGRPTLYSAEMVAKAKEYIDGGWKDTEDVMPSHIGMRKYIGVSSSTLYLWGQNHPDFSDILKECKEAQESVLLNNGLLGGFNSNITKLALGKHGYHDKSDSNVNANVNANVEWVVDATGNDSPTSSDTEET